MLMKNCLRCDSYSLQGVMITKQDAERIAGLKYPPWSEIDYEIIMCSFCRDEIGDETADSVLEEFLKND